MASADEKDALSIDFLYRAVYPNTDPAQVVNKMKPDCLELVAIAQKCKFKIAATKANNVVNKDDENALSTSFTHAKIGDFELRYQEEIPPPISEMDGYGKGCLDKCRGNL